MQVNGSQALPLVFVDNCAEAVVLAGLKPGVDGEIFNVVDDELPTGQQFLRAYKRKAKSFVSIRVPYIVGYAMSLLWENGARSGGAPSGPLRPARRQSGQGSPARPWARRKLRSEPGPSIALPTSPGARRRERPRPGRPGWRGAGGRPPPGSRRRPGAWGAAGRVEGLVGVDVAQPGDAGLVEQGGLEQGGAPGEARRAARTPAVNSGASGSRPVALLVERHRVRVRQETQPGEAALVVDVERARRARRTGRSGSQAAGRSASGRG